MPKYEKIKSKYRVCRDHKYSDCKEFDSLEDLIEWAKEEIAKKNKDINIGDKVRIIDTGYKYSSLPSGFFNNVYLKSILTSDEILHMVRHYNTKSDENYNGDFGIVEFIWEDKIFIKHQDSYNHDYIIIGKGGVEKC